MKVTASVLNVRSGPGTDFRVLRQLVRDTRVSVEETAGDWSWVEPGAGWVSRTYLAAPPRLAVPKGLQQIVSTFGPAASPAASAGRVILPAPVRLAWAHAEITRFACHAEMAAIFDEVLHRIHADGHWHLITEWGGCYMDRTKTANSEKKSTHAWGIAVDINPRTNGYGRKGDMPQEIVRAFEDAGFVWGGRWRTPDAMHFQYATGY